mgnify:CR=1 FL=1
MLITILAGITFTLIAILGVALTALTLAGLWLPIVGAIIWEIFYPGTFSWWTIGLAGSLCLAGEAVELLGAAHGSRKSGGGRAGAWGATIGSLLGAILGSFVLPIIGTIIGAVVGAGLGAITFERGISARPWREAFTSGSGAAKGRALAIVVKTAIALVVGVWIAVASIA